MAGPTAYQESEAISLPEALSESAGRHMAKVRHAYHIGDEQLQRRAERAQLNIAWKFGRLLEQNEGGA